MLSIKTAQRLLQVEEKAKTCLICGLRIRSHLTHVCNKNPSSKKS